MIRPLRTAHRRIFAVLVVAIPAVIFAGIAARRPENRAPGRIVVTLGTRSARGLLVAQRSGTELQVIATREIELPDLLAYWSNDNGKTPGANSVFLGPFVPGRPNRFTLPSDRGAGILILYSGPLAQVVDTVEIGGTP